MRIKRLQQMTCSNRLFDGSTIHIKRPSTSHDVYFPYGYHLLYSYLYSTHCLAEEQTTDSSHCYIPTSACPLGRPPQRLVAIAKDIALCSLMHYLLLARDCSPKGRERFCTCGRDQGTTLEFLSKWAQRVSKQHRTLI